MIGLTGFMLLLGKILLIFRIETLECCKTEPVILALKRIFATLKVNTNQKEVKSMI